MPREGRKKSTLGWYYVIVQGDKGQKIFGEKKMRKEYERLLKDRQLRTKSRVEVMLMQENTLHLLIDVFDGDMVSFMRPVQMRFSKLYRSLHPETTKVYRDRFRSEPIETDEELAAAMKKLRQLSRYSGTAGSKKVLEKKQQSKGRMHRRLQETLHYSGGFEALYDSNELIDQHRMENVLSEVPEYYGMKKEEALIALSGRWEQAVRGRGNAAIPAKERLCYLNDLEKRELGRVLRHFDHVPVRLICELLGLSRGVAERL